MNYDSVDFVYTNIASTVRCFVALAPLLPSLPPAMSPPDDGYPTSTTHITSAKNAARIRALATLAANNAKVSLWQPLGHPSFSYSLTGRRVYQDYSPPPPGRCSLGIVGVPTIRSHVLHRRTVTNPPTWFPEWPPQPLLPTTRCIVCVCYTTLVLYLTHPCM